jgi:excisionase family DNA binding protein
MHYDLGGFMQLLTYRELSKELSLSIRYLQKCVQEQGLHCIRFGKAVRFDPEDVAKWIATRREEHAGVIQDSTPVNQKACVNRIIRTKPVLFQMQWRN